MTLFADAVERAKPLEVRWGILAAGAGALLGVATAVNPSLGLGLAILVAVVVAILLRPSSLLLILVASVFMELITIGNVTITRVIAPVALFVVVAAAVRKGTQIRPAAPLFWAGAYALWALASGLWTVSPAGTRHLLSSLAIALVFMLSFASLLATRRDLDRVLYALAGLSLSLGVLSTLAFIGRPLFGFGLLQEGRVQGGTGDPSFFAAAQLIALPLILVLASNTQKGLVRNALYIVALVNIGSVLSTVSRGGTIQLLVVLILLLALPARSIFRSPTQKRVAMVALLSGMVVFFVHYSADLAPRLETIYSRSEDRTGSGRLAIWPAAVDAAQERPFLGVGYGAFVRTSVDRIYDTPGASIENFNVHPEEVHNVFLGTTAELGIPGITIFLGLLISTGLALRRTAKRARDAGADFISSVANALIVGLVGWCVGSMFIETETSRPIWILIGMTLALPRLIEEQEALEPQ